MDRMKTSSNLAFALAAGGDRDRALRLTGGSVVGRNASGGLDDHLKSEQKYSNCWLWAFEN